MFLRTHNTIFYILTVLLHKVNYLTFNSHEGLHIYDIISYFMFFSGYLSCTTDIDLVDKGRKAVLL